MRLRSIYHFQITPATIDIWDEQTGYRLAVRNQVVYRSSDGMVFALGESVEEASTRLGGLRAREKSGFCTIALFEPDGSNLRYEIRMMEHFTRLLHRQSQQARPLALFFAKLVDSFDYFLTIPDYETYPEARRRALEQHLQGHLRLRQLVINGREVQIPLWRRNLEYCLRRTLLTVLPLAATVAAYLSMPAVFASNPLYFLVYLLFVTYFVYFVGKFLWMLITRWFMPGDYRLCMLQGTKHDLSRFDRILANLVWGFSK